MSMLAIAFALNYLSWALLCLGLPRHYQQHFARMPSTRRAHALRATGWFFAVLALVFGVAQWGWGIGSVVWSATWMLSAVGWVLLQPYFPRFARVVAPVLLVLATFCWLMP
jgi:hypothetical protein